VSRVLFIVTRDRSTATAPPQRARSSTRAHRMISSLDPGAAQTAPPARAELLRKQHSCSLALAPAATKMPPPFPIPWFRRTVERSSATWPWRMRRPLPDRPWPPWIVSPLNWTSWPGRTETWSTGPSSPRRTTAQSGVAANRERPLVTRKRPRERR
jgi:hypothetical protein